MAMPPTVEDVRLRSPFLAQRFPADDDAATARLEVVVADTIAVVEALTCRTLDASLPERLWTIAVRAVALKAQRIAAEGDPDAVASSQENDGLRSISAGPWSESYFGPGEAAAAKVLDRDAATHEALWALATEECRDDWRRAWGQTVPHRPAAVTAQPGWHRAWR